MLLKTFSYNFFVTTFLLQNFCYKIFLIKFVLQIFVTRFVLLFFCYNFFYKLVLQHLLHNFVTKICYNIFPMQHWSFL